MEDLQELIKKKHEQMLYTTVRVVGEKGVGSGTVIYSKPVPNEEDGGNGIPYETYVLTNHHVVQANIKLEKKWSTLLKREVKMDILSECTVEQFLFEYGSWEAGHTGYKADIMAYDVDMDIALLRIKSTRKFEYVAKLFPRGEHKKRLRMFQPLYAIGCALGRPPIVTHGHLSGFNDVIENYPYWVSTAPTIFGNSGGAVFLSDTMEYVGIPSRIGVTIVGMSPNAITHLSYFIPIISIYKFLEEQMFNFVYDSSTNSDEWAKQRKAKRDRDERTMAVDMSRTEPDKVAEKEEPGYVG